MRIEHLIIKYKEDRGQVVSYHERLPDQVKRSTKTHEAELVVGSRYFVISWIGLDPTWIQRLCVRSHSRKARTPFSKSADLL